MPTLNATILNGASLSDAIEFPKTDEDYNGNALVALIAPASWTNAVITFQASDDGVNYYNVYDSAGNEISFTVTTAAARWVEVPVVNLRALRYLKVRSGTAGSAVNQGADRTIGLVFRKGRS